MIKKVIDSLTMISSLIFTIESVPQIIKIYKKKDAKSIAYGSIFLEMMGLFGYLIFSIYYNFIEIYPFVSAQLLIKVLLIGFKIYYDNYITSEIESIKSDENLDKNKNKIEV